MVEWSLMGVDLNSECWLVSRKPDLYNKDSFVFWETERFEGSCIRRQDSRLVFCTVVKMWDPSSTIHCCL
jgi:hypothetical protein